MVTFAAGARLPVYGEGTDMYGYTTASGFTVTASTLVLPREYVAGNDHLRLPCFGDRSFAARIRTEGLDWRTNLDVSITS